MMVADWLDGCHFLDACHWPSLKVMTVNLGSFIIWHSYSRIILFISISYAIGLNIEEDCNVENLVDQLLRQLNVQVYIF